MLNIESISTELKLHSNGVWCSRITEDVSCPTSGNEAYIAVEDHSFWFRHRNNCIISIVTAYPPKNNETIFDVGGGNGFVSLGLVKAGFDVVLVEPGRTGISQAKQRGLKHIICATLNTAKFKQHSLYAAFLAELKHAG